MKGKILINNPSSKPNIYVSSVTKTEITEIRQFVKVYIATQKEYRQELRDTFKDKFGIPVDNIVAQGCPNKGVKKIVEKYIPHQLVNYDPEVISWRCADKGGELKDQLHDPKTAGLVLHEDVISAWSCILNLLNKPNYVIIYKDEH